MYKAASKNSPARLSHCEQLPCSESLESSNHHQPLSNLNEKALNTPFQNLVSLIHARWLLSVLLGIIFKNWNVTNRKIHKKKGQKQNRTLPDTHHKASLSGNTSDNALHLSLQSYANTHPFPLILAFTDNDAHVECLFTSGLFAQHLVRTTHGFLCGPSSFLVL